MAAYKVVVSRVLVPIRFTEAGGAPATHETPDNELAVNERGAPQEVYQLAEEGDVLYTDKESYDALSDAEKENHNVYYVVNKNYIAQHTQERLGTLEEVEQKKSGSKK